MAVVRGSGGEGESESEGSGWAVVGGGGGVVAASPSSADSASSSWPVSAISVTVASSISPLPSFLALASDSGPLSPGLVRREKLRVDCAPAAGGSAVRRRFVLLLVCCGIVRSFGRAVLRCDLTGRSDPVWRLLWLRRSSGYDGECTVGSRAGAAREGGSALGLAYVDCAGGKNGVVKWSVMTRTRRVSEATGMPRRGFDGWVGRGRGVWLASLPHGGLGWGGMRIGMSRLE